MKKVYLVDSENVGDVWVPLLVSSQPEDEVLVFYTQKSPHMNYENVRMLKETDKEAVFVKCFEGSNALDFQLVTHLGYLLCEDAACAYVIVSNDAGFDAVVRYWGQRQMPVSRLSGKDCVRHMKERQKQEGRNKKEVCPDKTVKQQGSLELAERKDSKETPEEVFVPEEKIQDDKPIASGMPEDGIDETVMEKQVTLEYANVDGQLTLEAMQPFFEVSEGIKVLDMEQQVEEEKAGNEPFLDSVDMELEKDIESSSKPVIITLLSCISKDNLAEFHNALVVFFGKDTGKRLYQEIKNDTEWCAMWADMPHCSQKEKLDKYCRLVFSQNHLSEEYPKDFASFLCEAGNKRKNLNSLRAALQGQYGKENGMKYYSCLKSHIKIINRM